MPACTELCLLVDKIAYDNKSNWSLSFFLPSIAVVSSYPNSSISLSLCLFSSTFVLLGSRQCDYCSRGQAGSLHANVYLHF